MEKENVQRLAELRRYVIECYSSLDGKDSPTSVIKQQDVGSTLETIVRSIDDLLRPYVNFS